MTATAGTLLKIKPILTFHHRGPASVGAKVRGGGQVVDKLVELTVQACGPHRRATIWRWPMAAIRREWSGSGESSRRPARAEHLWTGEIDSTLSVYIGDGVLGAAIQVLD